MLEVNSTSMESLWNKLSFEHEIKFIGGSMKEPWPFEKTQKRWSGPPFSGGTYVSPNSFAMHFTMQTFACDNACTLILIDSPRQGCP